MKEKVKVAIATTSTEKIKGFIKGFSRFFDVEESQIEIYSKRTESRVSEQPFDSEIYQGARNRVEGIKWLTNFDFCASCEAGIESFAGKYFNVQVICIYEVKTQQYFWGKSAGWQIPTGAIEIIKESNLDEYLKDKGVKCIEELFGTRNSRKESVAQATELALYSSKLF